HLPVSLLSSTAPACPRRTRGGRRRLGVRAVATDSRAVAAMNAGATDLRRARAGRWRRASRELFVELSVDIKPVGLRQPVRRPPRGLGLMLTWHMLKGAHKVGQLRAREHDRDC